MSVEDRIARMRIEHGQATDDFVRGVKEMLEAEGMGNLLRMSPKRLEQLTRQDAPQVGTLEERLEKYRQSWQRHR